MVGVVGVVPGLLVALRKRLPEADALVHRAGADEGRGAVQGVAAAEEGLLGAVLR